MVDWGTVLGTIVSAVVDAGSVEGFLYFKANKGEATADAIDKSADAMKKLLDNFSQQQETFNKSLEDRDKSIRDRDELILQYKTQIRELKKEIDDMKTRMSEYERTITSMNVKIKDEIRVIDSLRCMNDSCKLRVSPVNKTNDEI